MKVFSRLAGLLNGFPQSEDILGDDRTDFLFRSNDFISQSMKVAERFCYLSLDTWWNIYYFSWFKF